MDAEFWAYSVKDEPVFNEKVCGGIVTHELGDVVNWIDKYIHSVAETFPREVRYCGIKVEGPESQYRRSVLKTGAERKFDIAQTDVFLVTLKFEVFYQGGWNSLVRELWLPYMRQGNTIMIKGTLATLHPVLADRLLSVTKSGLFFIIPRAKFNLDKLDYSVVRDGEIYTSIVLESILHNEESGKKSMSGKKVRGEYGVPITGHYLFARYGVSGAFLKYYNTQVIVCTPETVYEEYDPDIHYRFKGRDRHGKHKRPMKTHYVLLVPKDAFDAHPGLVNLVMSFFYITEHHNESFRYEDIHRCDDWVKTLAYTTFCEKDNLPVLMTKIEKHIDSLDDYIDDLTHKTIQDEGIDNIHSIYDLLNYANDHVIDLMRNTDVGSMWGKYLMVNRYVLRSITFRINELDWELKKKKGDFTFKSVSQLFSSKLTSMCFMGITKDHGEKENVQYSGDNMLFKHTLIAVRQVDAVPNKSAKAKINVNDLAYHFHPSILDSGSVVNFPKPNPDGRNKLNPFITLSDNNQIQPNPKYIELLNSMFDEILFGK